MTFLKTVPLTFATAICCSGTKADISTVASRCRGNHSCLIWGGYPLPSEDPIWKFFISELADEVVPSGGSNVITAISVPRVFLMLRRPLYLREGCKQPTLPRGAELGPLCRNEPAWCRSLSFVAHDAGAVQIGDAPRPSPCHRNRCLEGVL